MALMAAISTMMPLSISVPISRPLYNRPHDSRTYASLSSSSSSSESKSSLPKEPRLPSATSSSIPLVVEPSGPPESGLNYAQGNPNGNPVALFVTSTESTIERGCVYIIDAYKIYWSCCVKGIHSGQMVLRLVEAIDVYLAGTVMLIFGMGLYGLFISNVSPDAPPSVDRALKGSSLFGMFSLKERPKWMKICSLDELKTKVGHVIVMILLVKMFERSKMVQITTGVDLLSYSVCIFLSSASLYILHNLHKSD
ncbi:uncharacterized protein LOC121239865 isoform X2 [Juglans microcarpa x Juglans regia]|uniref:uncharacterized protein LOC121239865 isoform X2 n=1 Tax=Juglans microcarpa x Juglans regia TaxID=2249226 RepID=UPI001B7E5A75|nr:uncharacterized protein LOC121239865 isoform X2 [Juglans microcarpa x Juglans regia]